MTVMTALVIAALYAVGTYLLLQRTLTRIVIGLAMMGHGANLLLLAAGGPPGAPPLVGAGAPTGPYADPLPQALALTAIVITFGVVAFLLALAYRSWTATRDDEVEDDLEDRRIAGRLEDAGAGGAGRWSRSRERGP
jgi:multicomponent Na+:H+ antiporter subunit C